MHNRKFASRFIWCEASSFSLNQVQRLRIITDEGVWVQSGLEETG